MSILSNSIQQTILQLVQTRVWSQMGQVLKPGLLLISCVFGGKALTLATLMFPSVKWGYAIVYWFYEA